MHKQLLPLLFALIISSCNKPASETTSDADSTTLADSAIALDPSEDPTNDTAYNGNMDGDYFVPDSLRSDGDLENPEMIDVHEPVIDVSGFSDDGKYFAFTQYLVGEGADGTGSVFVIDVAKNEWAKKPDLVESTNDDLETELAKTRDQVLKQFNITYRKNLGKEYNIRVDNNITVDGKQYKIDLAVQDLLIDLRVKGNGKDIVLQKDKKLPASRGTVREYRLNKAYVLGDRIAAFIEYDGGIAVGFENYRYYDRKNIAVTGVVK